MSAWKFRRGRRDDTGVLRSRNREDGGDDLSSASGVGGSSGLLGSTGVDGMQNHMMWTNGFTTP